MKRLGYLDGLRGIAALWVVFDHVWYTAWAQTHPDRWAKLCGAWMLLGRLAVPVFIVLSGACLALPLREGKAVSARQFYLRRGWRILPPYYLSIGAALLTVPLIGQRTGGYWDKCVPVTAAGLWQHLFLAHDLTHNHQINHVYWSIAVEWRIYLLFPVLVYLWQRGRRGIAAALVLALAPFQPYLLYFALGCLAVLLPRPAPLRAAQALPASTLALCALDILGRAHVPLAALNLCAAAASAAWLSRLLTGQAKGPQEWLGRKPFAWLGAISYSLYLTHGPVLELVWRYAVHPLGIGANARFALLAGLGTAASVLIARGFYEVAERPFLKRPWERPARLVTSQSAD